MAGIYIHIPFCRSKCRYCDFYSTASFGKRREMLDAILKELEERWDYLRGEPVRTLYFGGGTPSVLSPDEVREFTGTVKRLFPAAGLREVTFEANPEDLNGEYLDGLRSAGIDRLSIGVQSFSDDHLAFFRRRHDGETAFSSVLKAKKAGFGNISVDLIYGVPGMTTDRWKSNLDRFLSLDVPHFSAYHLTLEPGTPFGKMEQKGWISAVTDEVSREHYEVLERTLAAAGYEHYEVSSFARPGFRSEHNGSYWRGVPYLGVGPSAHSYDGGKERRWNVASNREYLAGGACYEKEILTDRDRYNEFVMTALRTSDGFSWKDAAERFPAEMLAHLTGGVEALAAERLLFQDGGTVRMDPSRFLISDHIIARLFL